MSPETVWYSRSEGHPERVGFFLLYSKHVLHNVSDKRMNETEACR